MICLRPATEADREALESFVCAPLGVRFQTEVEDFARTLLDWRLEEPGRDVFVLEADGAVAGFVAFEADEDGFFINAAAIHTAAQGRGLGTLMLSSFLADLAAEHPGAYAWWKVDPRNLASCIMSSRVGADDDYPPEIRPHVRYTVVLTPES